jgi:hypothetical protein
LISGDRQADNTDVYAFVTPDKLGAHSEGHLGN